MVAINSSTRRMVYNPVNSAGPFPMDFPLFSGDGSDLEVRVNGLIVPAFTFSGETESGFYGAPNTWINCSVTLPAPVTGELVIDGLRQPRRQSQYAEGRGVPARDHNTELNILTAGQQELRRDVDKALIPIEGLPEAVQAAQQAAETAVAAAEDAVEAAGSISSPVLFIAQSLTGPQQAQALTNLGASSTGRSVLQASDATAARAALGIGARGYWYGIALASNASDLTNDIDFSACEAASDDADPRLIKLLSTMTKRTDAAWSAGSGNGGWLDGASMPNGTGHAFLISRSDTGQVDVGLSASLSPTLPTNYDRKRRIGSVVRKSGALLQFMQLGAKTRLWQPPVSASATNPGTSAVLRALDTPSGIRVDAKLAVLLGGQTVTATAVYISQPEASDQAASRSAAPLATVAFNTVVNGQLIGTVEVWTNLSSQVRTRLEWSDSTAQLLIVTLGWEDLTL